ncbi:MAG: hypothetical protein KDD47_02415 [Acidobacteria bacterium]|nr:hypothetical protein [Acidobacteriota bacterium]
MTIARNSSAEARLPKTFVTSLFFGLSILVAAPAWSALPADSIFVRHIRGGFGETLGFDTHVPTSAYACGIVGVAALGGDINEDDDGDILYAFAYQQSGNWWIKADFRSHRDDHETWDLTLLCAKRAVANLGGPGSSSVPLFFQTYTNRGDNVDYDTGYSTASYVCGIVGYEALDGDINENGSGTILRMYMYPSLGRWRIRADFRTHHDNENWNRIDVLCARTSVATIGTPSTSSSKDVFLKEYFGLASNGFFNTGISTSSFVCGLVGMEAYDGDIEEHGKGDILQAYAYRQSGTWWIRSDFRTHNNHENWNMKLLCIKSGPASWQAPLPLACGT